MALKLTLFSTGYCLAHEAIAERGGAWRNIRFHATCALIEHPEAGKVLFDTGYSPRFFAETRPWPEKLYALATPVTTRPEWSLASQLAARGIAAAEITHILLSHLHADHVAGLADFPQAQVWCSELGYRYFRDRKGLAAVRKGFLPGLLPPDLEERLHFFEDCPKLAGTDPLGERFDWWGDQCLQLLPLPGHCRGQYGLLLEENGQPQHLLAADAFWREPNWRERRLPSPLIRLFIDSWPEYVSTIDRLRAFHRVHPGVPILACHSPATLEQFVPDAARF